MARLTFSVSRAGPIVPVWIGETAQQVINSLTAGQPVARPVQARGQLDTGSTVTAVAASILHSLGATPVSQTATTVTAAGKVAVRLFEISLSIMDPLLPSTPWLTLPNLVVTELTTVLPDEDVLIGLDVLLTCKMQLDGPGLSFALDF